MRFTAEAEGVGPDEDNLGWRLVLRLIIGGGGEGEEEFIAWEYAVENPDALTFDQWFAFASAESKSLRLSKNGSRSLEYRRNLLVLEQGQVGDEGDVSSTHFVPRALVQEPLVRALQTARGRGYSFK